MAVLASNAHVIYVVKVVHFLPCRTKIPCIVFSVKGVNIIVLVKGCEMFFVYLFLSTITFHSVVKGGFDVGQRNSFANY
jgi:hypothetical protein